MIVKHKITGTKINEDKKKEKFEQILDGEFKGINISNE